MYHLKWKFLQIARVLVNADTLVTVVSALRTEFVSYFSVTVIVIVTVIVLYAMFIL